MERAVQAFRDVVGSDHVLTDPDQMREFRDPFWHLDWDDYEACAVVQPESVEEIQAIVRLANEHRVPLWTTSQGRNNGYGGSSPRVRGSVVVNLRRMNRVLKIDEELGYAEVEPGVSWYDLYAAIQAGGHRLMLSCADLGWGSVIGNTLDHGCTYLPYGVDMSAACGLEVVLANGEASADRYGSHAGQSRVAHLQARARADARSAVHAVQLRDRDQDGLVADALPRDVHADLGASLERRRSGAAGRHAPPAVARRHDPDDPAGMQHAHLRIIHDHSRAVVGRRRTNPRRGDRPDGARARAGAMDDARRAVRRRGGSRPSLREGQGGVRADPGSGGLGDEDDAREREESGASSGADPGRGARSGDERDDGLVRRPSRDQAATSASPRWRRSPAATPSR